MGEHLELLSILGSVIHVMKSNEKLTEFLYKVLSCCLFLNNRILVSRFFSRTWNDLFRTYPDLKLLDLTHFPRCQGAKGLGFAVVEGRGFIDGESGIFVKNITEGSPADMVSGG